jgi:hypothetical protein
LSISNSRSVFLHYGPQTNNQLPDFHRGHAWPPHLSLCYLLVLFLHLFENPIITESFWKHPTTEGWKNSTLHAFVWRRTHNVIFHNVASSNNANLISWHFRPSQQQKFTAVLRWGCVDALVAVAGGVLSPPSQ